MQKLGAADIAALIRREISKGNLRRLDRLPAERDLAQTYGVARNTVREALSRLEREDFVEIRPGSGTYVTFAPSDSTSHAICAPG